MYSAFVKLLNMSAAASIPIAAVAALRFLLRKTPKKYICLLWAIAALRLVIPFSISSAVSAYNYIGSQQQSGSQMEYIQYNGRAENPMGEIPVFTGNLVAADTTAEEKTGTDIYLPVAMGIWFAGFAGMLGYAVMSYLRIRRQTQEAVRYSGNIYRCDHLPSPFILGIIRPIIYLPSDLKEPQRQSVIAHEQAHIRRLDHWWKPMGYLVLSVHWFNPLVWVGYALLSRDIETACDERVIEKMSTKQKQEYSETLLQCSMPQKFISACPLAFGETGVKQRIKGILNYRKPTTWLIVVSLLICMCAAAAFLTDPVQAEPAAESHEIEYQLVIGSENVSYISIEHPGGSGRCCHADGTAFEVGEAVTLEPLSDVEDLNGVTLCAYTDNEELVWEMTIQENTKDVYAFYDGFWSLQKANSKDSLLPDAEHTLNSQLSQEETAVVQDTSDDIYIKTGIVTTEGDIALNVRGGPSFSYPIAAYRNAGDKVYIVDTVAADGVEWGMIGKDKWVCMEYITINDADDLPEASVVEEIILRSSPSVQAREVCTLTPDSRIFIEENENIADEKWYYVRVDNMIGWVPAKYLTDIESDEAEADDVCTKETVYPFIDETVISEDEIILYSSPSIQGRIIGTVHSDDEIIIQKTESVANPEWYFVSCGNMKGWMDAELYTGENTAHHDEAHTDNHH